jgi:hypothetical protein
MKEFLNYPRPFFKPLSSLSRPLSLKVLMKPVFHILDIVQTQKIFDLFSLEIRVSGDRENLHSIFSTRIDKIDDFFSTRNAQ